MKKIFAVLCIVCMVLSLSLLGLASDKKAGKSSTLNGWITDEKCSAKTAKSGTANEQCSKQCIESGSKAVFVNDKDHSVWAIDNPDAIKGHEGHHVAVTGTPANNALHVDSVKMLASEGGGM